MGQEKAINFKCLQVSSDAWISHWTHKQSRQITAGRPNKRTALTTGGYTCSPQHGVLVQSTDVKANDAFVVNTVHQQQWYCMAGAAFPTTMLSVGAISLENHSSIKPHVLIFNCVPVETWYKTTHGCNLSAFVEWFPCRFNWRDQDTEVIRESSANTQQQKPTASPLSFQEIMWEMFCVL